MKLDITSKGILTLTGKPKHKNEFLIRSSVEILKIIRPENQDGSVDMEYWESEKPVKDGYYIYVNTDLDSIENEIDTVLDPDPDPDPSETELFTIVNLRNCLLNYEKKILEESLYNCNSGIICQKTSEDKQMADFLLSTVFVIENLVCKGFYQEAAEIVEKVNSCNGICQNTNYTNKKCNCNGRNTIISV